MKMSNASVGRVISTSNSQPNEKNNPHALSPMDLTKSHMDLDIQIVETRPHTFHSWLQYINSNEIGSKPLPKDQSPRAQTVNLKMNHFDIFAAHLVRYVYSHLCMIH